MKIGDLVKCQAANGALGVIVGFGYGRFCRDIVEIILAHNNKWTCCRSQHLEVLSEGR